MSVQNSMAVHSKMNITVALQMKSNPSRGAELFHSISENIDLLLALEKCHGIMKVSMIYLLGNMNGCTNPKGELTNQQADIAIPTAMPLHG